MAVVDLGAVAAVDLETEDSVESRTTCRSICSTDMVVMAFDGTRRSRHLGGLRGATGKGLALGSLKRLPNFGPLNSRTLRVREIQLHLRSNGSLDHLMLSRPIGHQRYSLA